MTFPRGSANRPIKEGISLEQDASLSIAFLREPEKVPQPAEALTREQRDLDHFMRCTRKGCRLCA